MRWILGAVIGFSLVGLAIMWSSEPADVGQASRAVIQSLPGMATLTGTVESAKPFKAARVYIRNVDKRVTHMVYTNAGRFRAVALFPGNYEVLARVQGLESSTHELVLTAGDGGSVELSLGDAPPVEGVEYQSYDEIYPQGPGRAIAERTCIRCHGVNFLPSKKWNEEQWTAAVDFMRGRGHKPGVVQVGTHMIGLGMIKDDMMSPQDREIYIPWLVENFGPGSKRRAVRFDVEMPVDEGKISKAMYIEYDLPEDPAGYGVNDPEFSRERMAAQTELPGQLSLLGRRWPQDARLDPSGNVWVVDRGIPHRLVMLDPRTAAFKEYLLADPTNGTHDLIVDKEGTVWVPEHHGLDSTRQKHLTGFNPKTETWEVRVPLDPDGALRLPQKFGFGVTLDSQQNVYVGWLDGGALSKWDRQAEKMSVFPLSDPRYNVYGVEADNNDNIWVALFHAGKIAKFDTKTNEWTEYTAPTQPAQIRRLNADAKNNIWFGIWSSGRRPGKLVKLDQTTGNMIEYTLPHDNASPYHVASYRDEIWIGDAGQGGTLIKFNTQDETFTYYPSPKRADKARIQITRDGAIWYAPRDSGQASVGVLYPDMDAISTLAAYPPMTAAQ